MDDLQVDWSRFIRGYRFTNIELPIVNLLMPIVSEARAQLFTSCVDIDRICPKHAMSQQGGEGTKIRLQSAAHCNVFMKSGLCFFNMPPLAGSKYQCWSYKWTFSSGRKQQKCRQHMKPPKGIPSQRDSWPTSLHRPSINSISCCWTREKLQNLPPHHSLVAGEQPRYSTQRHPAQICVWGHQFRGVVYNNFFTWD